MGDKQHCSMCVCARERLHRGGCCQDITVWRSPPLLCLIVMWLSLPLFLSLPSSQEKNITQEKSFPYSSITLLLISFLHPQRMDGWAGSWDEEERGSLRYLSPYHSISEGEALGHTGKGTRHTHDTLSKGKKSFGCCELSRSAQLAQVCCCSCRCAGLKRFPRVRTCMCVLSGLPIVSEKLHP